MSLPSPLRILLGAFLFFSVAAQVFAQSSGSTTSPPTQTTTAFPANGSIITSGNTTLSLSTFLSSTTSSVTTTSVTRSGNRDVTITTALPTAFNVTATATATITASSQSASATQTQDPSHLDTKIDPAFGVLGAILILTGLPSAFLGHKNRW